MEEGDFEKLQLLGSQSIEIEEAKHSFLRAISGLKNKIDEVQSKANYVEVSLQFYEMNQTLFRSLQKYLKILTRVAEVLHQQNLQEIHPLKRQLLTTFNRQALRFNILISEEVKLKMKQLNPISKIKIEKKDEEEKNPQLKEENENFSLVMQSLADYLVCSMETQKTIEDRISEAYTHEGQKQERNLVKKRQSFFENQITDEQRQARNAYKWFILNEYRSLMRNNINKYSVMGLMLVVGIYLLLQRGVEL